MSTLFCYETDNVSDACPLLIISKEEFREFQKSQKPFVINWLQNNFFTAEKGQYCLLPDEHGKIARVLVGVDDEKDMFLLSDLVFKLPLGNYYIENAFDAERLEKIVIGWGLGAYQFNRYKASMKSPSRLTIPVILSRAKVENIVTATYLVRDLINTPPDDMNPDSLAEIAEDLAKKYQANYRQIVGKALVKENYPAIYTVGKASIYEPRLIDFTWGEKEDPLVVLVGKGVCFDTGGLDMKSGANMSLMKKDMGGAAHALALAALIMEAKLPIQLRVLIPAVENAVSGSAYHPSDIIKMRNGKTVEVGDTDAEGRLILADALTLACEETNQKPELLIDFATLTGAARIALGTEVGVIFSNNSVIAQKIYEKSVAEQDPVWILPLHQNYRKSLQSKIADIRNVGNNTYAGAIVAALFLEMFVSSQVDWVHADIMAWNIAPRPGFPEGGEAMGIRAFFAYLSERYGQI